MKLIINYTNLSMEAETDNNEEFELSDIVLKCPIASHCEHFKNELGKQIGMYGKPINPNYITNADLISAVLQMEDFELLLMQPTQLNVAEAVEEDDNMY